ncbi:hypothetical protein HW555_013795 [Spodoptera exigua]|uniref:Uncharacterized protein n=1 Tax=Spodoptera exigua TaxID=7107 RepID=A0A835G2Q9_SPOEX|nr:hypothetical protein HW555_013795 [Spodoptera exigua]
MSQVSEIISIHKNVQESLLKRMGDIEAQIQSAGPAKDTVARVAEEFRAFRELVFDMLKMLRAQVIECCRNIDNLEMRSRRKAAIFQGMPELDNEDCSGLILGVINTKLGLDLPVSALKVCHRLGASNKDHHRPILVKFSSLDYNASVWNAIRPVYGALKSPSGNFSLSPDRRFSQKRAIILACEAVGLGMAISSSKHPMEINTGSHAWRN